MKLVKASAKNQEFGGDIMGRRTIFGLWDLDYFTTQAEAVDAAGARGIVEQSSPADPRRKGDEGIWRVRVPSTTVEA